MFKRLVPAVMIAALTAAAASPAHAHKLKVFAAAVGARIEGSVYFVGGGPARGARIVVESADGTLIEALNADDSGAFAFTAKVRTDHVIVTSSADGHSARTTIPASVLPASLPLPASGLGASAAEGRDLTAPAPPHEGKTGDLAAMEARIAEAVAQQVAPLREQLSAYEDRVRLRDVLGGLGYILGLAGLFAWMRARRPTEGKR
jgi:nickel transport protein